MIIEAKTKYLHQFGLITLIYFIIFLKLDSFHMRWWDESMFAVNTYEMLHNGKYFSLYFDNVPDLFNTKPPLSIWIQILFVKLLGYNELALRLPSAIAGALSILLLFNFISKNYDLIWAWISALILLTSYGFINFHTSRTGDSDSLLTLFLLISNLYFIKYLLHNSKRNIFLFLVFIALAFATKMYAALLFAPAYIIILIHQKKIKEFILNKYFLSGIILVLFTSIGMIYLRELDTPGYIQQILFKDAGRIFNVVENHKESTTFYLDNLFKQRFSLWAILLIVGCVCTFFIENKSEKKLLLNFIILILIYLVIITFSITKLEWYDMPLYPYMAVISAYPLCLLIKTVSFSNQSLTIKNTMFLVVAIFIYPYYMMFDKSQGNTISNGEKILEANERYIFKRNKEMKDLDGIKVYHVGYNGSLLFYKYKLSQIGQKIELNNNGIFQINDKVLLSNDSLKGEIQSHYSYEVIDKFDKAQLIHITQILPALF